MFTNSIRSGAPALVAALLLGASALAGCASDRDEVYREQGYGEQGYGGEQAPVPGEEGTYSPEGTYQEAPGTTGQTRNPYETDY